MAERVELFGMRIDGVRMHQAVQRILEWCAAGVPCRYVFTPNVDHVVNYQENEALRAAYAGAALVLPDGKPVVWASRLVGRPLPETVRGSELAPALFDAAPEGLRIFLLGAAPGVADAAARVIRRRWPHVDVVGTHSPPFGFEDSESENRVVCDLVAACRPQAVIVAMGGPQQEIWAHRRHAGLQVPVLLCLGATIDLLAGSRRQAPVWMRRSGLEWFFRMLQEPRRLFPRYARDARRFFPLVWREWRRGGAAR